METNILHFVYDGVVWFGVSFIILEMLTSNLRHL